jgi:hypothetical protein
MVGCGEYDRVVKVVDLSPTAEMRAGSIPATRNFVNNGIYLQGLEYPGLYASLAKLVIALHL